METNKISTKKFILKYGIILGTIWIVYLFLFYSPGILHSSSGNFFAYIIEITLHSILIFPIYRYKMINNGFLNLKQALRIGMSVALITYLIGTAYNIAIVEVIEPVEVIQNLNDARENMLNNNPDMSPEKIKKIITAPKKLYSFYIQLIGPIMSLIFSFAIALFAGAIMFKRKKL